MPTAMFLSSMDQRFAQLGYDEEKRKSLLSQLAGQYSSTLSVDEVEEEDEEDCLAEDGEEEVVPHDTDTEARAARIEQWRAHYRATNPFTEEEQDATQNTINDRRRFGRTALHEAAYDNDADAVEDLLAQEADSTAVDNNGVTPFGLATLQGSMAVLEVFAAWGITS